MTETTPTHSCYGAIFCGQPRKAARDECPVCIRETARVYDDVKEESEPCQRGTVGCCIDHARDTGDSCETY